MRNIRKQNEDERANDSAICLEKLNPLVLLVESDSTIIGRSISTLIEGREAW